MEVSTINIILDVILVLAGLAMVWSARGIGGIVGRTLTYIMVGALITGFAHLIGTLTVGWFSPYDGPVHRLIVLLGFIFLMIGFRQLQSMKR
jgi:hypothetical protein